MCPPDHYSIDYEINPWMHRANAADRELARVQWERLHQLLLDLGAHVELIPQQPMVPDMVFTANAGVVAGTRFVPSNFRHTQRQPESPHFTEWFDARGYEIVPIDPSHPWEGEGDVLDAGSHVFAASGPRTMPAALDALDEALGIQTIRLELTDPRFYHLDTCFFPVDERCALFVPAALSPASIARLGSIFEDLVEVPIEEAEQFACNALRIDDTVVLNSGCHEVEAALRRRGYRCAATPTGEFIKAGGSVKCLVLTLDRFTSAA